MSYRIKWLLVLKIVLFSIFIFSIDIEVSDGYDPSIETEAEVSVDVDDLTDYKIFTDITFDGEAGWKFKKGAK
tara:strand:- start:77865 stop:78083 length:219 start_codon:yes stop_codon:yes gene_type:complete